VADPNSGLGAAVLAARGTSCAPLRPDRMVEQAASQINQSTGRWLDHTARAAPVADALPLLKDLGYTGSKATTLSGAGKTEADSIKALVLQGYLAIPNCEYIDYGVNSLYNESKHIILTTVVLAA
jgi:hypothetical protein